MNLGALQFQSSVDRTLPIRLMHYVACFYSELIKKKVITPGQGLPPVFPVVLYNGSKRWTAKTDIFDMIAPEPPGFLRVYQPHLRYYLIDEGRYTEGGGSDRVDHPGRELILIAGEWKAHGGPIETLTGVFMSTLRLPADTREQSARAAGISLPGGG